MGEILRNLCIASAIALSALVAGCASTTGNQSMDAATMEDVRAKIVKGKTTKADVQKAYGDPASRGGDANGDVWVYAFTKVDQTQSQVASAGTLARIPFANTIFGAGKGPSEGKSLTVMFDQRGVVRDYHFHASGQTQASR